MRSFVLPRMARDAPALQSMLSDAPVGGLDSFQVGPDPHVYLDGGDSQIIAAMESERFDTSDLDGGNSMRPDQILEYSWIFVLKRSKRGSDAKAFFALWQLNILLEMLYDRAVAELGMLGSSKLSSEEAIWKYVNETRDGNTGQPSVIAFLHPRFILETFAFLGAATNNAEPQAPDGTGLSVVMGGHTKMKACILTPTREQQGVYMVLKRKRTKTGGHGSFAFHPVTMPIHSALRPSLQDRFYTDLSGRERYGPVITVGNISMKDRDDDSKGKQAWYGSGIGIHDGRAIDNGVAYNAAKSLTNIGINLTNYGGKIPIVV